MNYRLGMLVLLSLLCSSTFAQREAYSFIWGNCDTTENSCSGIYGTAIMRFNDDSIASIDTVNFPSDFFGFSTCISDSNGRMLMAFNNKYLFDSSGTILQEYIAADDELYYRQSALFFKLKGNGSYYYLLNSKAEQIAAPADYPAMNNRTRYHLLTRIKIDDLGFDILSVDTLFRNDTLPAGSIHACRHANGRDWWIFQSTYNQRNYLRGLLTPDGVSFENYEGPGPDLFQGWGFNKFSSDGTLFFHYIPGITKKMQIYRFDRCTGELNNLDDINFSNWIQTGDFNPFSLSPDGSKIYMGRSNPELTNYETIQVDVETGQMTVLADSVYSPCLTPNLKWVISGYQDAPFTPIDDLNIFTEPNNLGNQSSRVIKENCLPVSGFVFEPPEWANHLLGPIDGTICDSLGLNDDLSIKKKEEFSFTLFPNPGNNALHIKTNLPLPLRITIRNGEGMLVLESDFNKRNFSLSYELDELSPGIYFVELSNSVNQTTLVRKWVKLE